MGCDEALDMTSFFYYRINHQNALQREKTICLFWQDMSIAHLLICLHCNKVEDNNERRTILKVQKNDVTLKTCFLNLIIKFYQFTLFLRIIFHEI